MTGFIACVFLFPNRVSARRRFEGLEPDDGKLSRPVLRGLGSSNGVRPLGLRAVCNTKITRFSGWRLHHCVPRVMGGSARAENRVLLHPECHDRVHCLRLSVSKPRLREEAF